MSLKRFFMDTDDSSHWFIVPVARKAEWEAWLELPEDDEARWSAPKFAQEVGGSPTLVTFSQPEVQ